MIFLRVAGFQSVPAFDIGFFVEDVGSDFGVTQEGFVISTVIDGDVDIGMLPKNIAVQDC